MIMHRKPDGSYEEITAIKTKKGENIGKIVGKDGSVYFTSAVNSTAEGYPCIIPKSVGKNAINYSIYGNSIQTGTPSPDNPVEVESVGERTKNIIPTPSTETWVKGYVTATGTTGLSTKMEWTSPMIELDPTQTRIAISISIPYEITANNWMCIAFYDENETFINRLSGEKSTNTMTVPANARYAKFCARFFSNTRIGEVEFQGEYGTVVTEYEPYGYKIPVVTSDDSSEPVTTNIYLDEPLQKIGDYADVLNFDVQTVTRKIKKVVFNGTEEITYQAIYERFYTELYSLYNQGLRLTPLYSTHYMAITDGRPISEVPNYSIYTASPSDKMLGKQILFKDLDYTSVSGFKSYLANQYAAGTPVTVWYVSADETEESVTLPKIPTFKGTTVITTGTDVPPSNIKITYKSRRKNYD